MKTVAIQLVELMDRKPQDGYASKERPDRPTDIKIQALAVRLPAMIEGGSLFASAVSPRIVIGFSLKKTATGSQKSLGEGHIEFQRKKEEEKKYLPGWPYPQGNKYFPIGLSNCEQYPWVNALMQFILFISSLREIFIYTPKSFSACNEFIDRYFLDIKEGAAVSKADGFQVVLALLGKFPLLAKATGSPVNHHEIIQYLLQSAWGSSFSKPEWQIRWDGKLDLQRQFEKKNFPLEMLVGLSSLYDSNPRKEGVYSKNLEKHYAFPDGIYFDLDAFIEYRPDGTSGTGQSGSYFTYLKVDGFWVQCSDVRITLLRRATFLEVPLSRGVLFHYRRVASHHFQ